MPPRRSPLVVIAVAAIALGAIVLLGRLAAFGADASPSPGHRDPFMHVVGQPGAGSDARLLAKIPIVHPARVTASSVASDAAGGKALLSGEGTALIVEVGWRVAVFEGPVAIGDESWYRVYALANPNSGPTEFFGWVPLHDPAGAETLAFEGPPICPDGPGISVLGALDPFTRARCMDTESVELIGWTWDRMLPTAYAITPEWMGDQHGDTASTISISDDPRHQFVNGPGPYPFLEVQVPPGLERPPFEFEISLSAHVADSTSSTCLRLGGGGSDLPEDDPQNGPLWCTTRLVGERWAPILGPEQRPIDLSSPQLHRHPERGPNTGCRGVGMEPLIFRLDAAQIDPVWLEAVGFPESRIIPSFDPGFRIVGGSNPVIIDEEGHLVARNGTPVDTDGALAGHAICPTGRVVYFD